MSGRPSLNPARFVPTYALGFAAGGESIETVSAQSPLPVSIAQATDASVPLSGTTGAGQVVGPFVPIPGVPVTVVLSGDWQGTVRVMRSPDSGATLHPLTAGGMPWARFTENACEQVWEETDATAGLYLDIAIAGGLLEYRMGH